MSSQIPPGIETFPLGLQRYYLEAGEIAVIVGTGGMSREAIDEWADAMIDVIHTRAAAGKPAFVLSDTSAKEQGFSNYARTRVNSINESIPPGMAVYTAMLFPSSVISQFITLFVGNLMRMTSKDLHTRMFNDRDEALAWLNAMRARREE